MGYYAFSSGEYSDYRVNCFMQAPDGLDIQSLYNEFCETNKLLLIPFAEEEPQRTSVGYPPATDDARVLWWNRLRDYDNAQRADWNNRGYEGWDKKDWFVSWLEKDKGFEVLSYVETNTDNDLHP